MKLRLRNFCQKKKLYVETLCRQLEDAYNCKNRNAELESVLMAAQKSNSDLEEGLSLIIRFPHTLFFF